jgi:hypothetical protein
MASSGGTGSGDQTRMLRFQVSRTENEHGPPKGSLLVLYERVKKKRIAYNTIICEC